MTANAVGTPIANNVGNKEEVLTRTKKIRETLLYAEEVYFSFRDEMEEVLQNIKYQVDKLTQILGEDR